MVERELLLLHARRPASSTEEEGLLEGKGPWGLVPSYQVKPQTERSEMQTDSRKTVENRLLVSLMDLSEGHVFLIGREPRCRNRLKSRKRAAAIA